MKIPPKKRELRAVMIGALVGGFLFAITTLFALHGWLGMSFDLLASAPTALLKFDPLLNTSVFDSYCAFVNSLIGAVVFASLTALAQLIKERRTKNR